MIWISNRGSIRSRVVDGVRNKDSLSSRAQRARTFERPTLSNRQAGVLEGETIMTKAVVLGDLERVSCLGNMDHNT